MVRKIVIVAVIFFLSCAKERELKRVAPNAHRLSKAGFQGTYFYLKSLAEVKFPSGVHRDLPSGLYLDADKLVQFVIREKSLDVVAVDPLFQNQSDAEKNTILASFRIHRHLDVMRKQNVDGKDTHEEEETETRRPWGEREYMVVDFSEDVHDQFYSKLKASHAADHLEIDAARGVINVRVSRQLKDDTLTKTHYAFRRFEPSGTYQQREYPRRWQKRFGFFKTRSFSFDRYGQITQRSLKEFISRRDPSQTVTYHFGPGFPTHLKDAIRDGFRKWNDVFRGILGRDLLEIQEHSGQDLGDLSHNLILYDDSPSSTHGVLAYAPSAVNPRTGEILKGDVIFYGGTLKRAILHSRTWARLLQGAPLNPLVMPRATDDPSDRSSAPLVYPFFPNPVIREDFLAKMQGEFLPERALPRLRQAQLNELSQRITPLSESLLAETSGLGMDIAAMSDEAIERLIFSRLIVHELGHNLGLRHNFEGFSDHAHHQGHQSSTVMGYALIATHEPPGPGPYDVGAVRFAYAPDDSAHAQLQQAGFHYCTDDEVLTSRNGWCGKFYHGRTLTEIVQHLAFRYYGSYAFNNLRNDRLHFGHDDDEYLRKVTLNLAPLRIVHDYADSILHAYSQGRKDRLWELLGRRIEANLNDHGETVTASVTEGVDSVTAAGETHHDLARVEKRLSVAKIEGAVDDARQARDAAVQRLIQIILDNGRVPLEGGREYVRRTDYDDYDQVHRDLLRKGVLPDKLIALLLMGTSAADPVDPGRSISGFGSGYHYLFTSLLSNTVASRPETNIGETRNELAQFDINLREMALFVIRRYLAREGEQAHARELVQMSKVQLGGTAANPPLDVTAQVMMISLENILAVFNNLQREMRNRTVSHDRVAAAIEEFRQNRRALNRARLASDLPAAEFLTMELRLRTLEPARNRLNRAYALNTGTEHYVADVWDSRFHLETASGRLIRDNMNVIEDELLATIDCRRALEQSPTRGNERRLEALRQNEQLLRGKFFSEKIFAEKLYRLYHMESR